MSTGSFSRLGTHIEGPSNSYTHYTSQRKQARCVQRWRFDLDAEWPAWVRNLTRRGVSDQVPMTTSQLPRSPTSFPSQPTDRDPFRMRMTTTLHLGRRTTRKVRDVLHYELAKQCNLNQSCSPTATNLLSFPSGKKKTNDKNCPLGFSSSYQTTSPDFSPQHPNQ